MLTPISPTLDAMMINYCFFDVLDQTGNVDPHFPGGIACAAIDGEAFAYLIDDSLIVSSIF